MSDETDEPEINDENVAAEQPAPATSVATAPSPYSSRGAAAPQGQDIGARPAPVMTPTNVAEPNARIDRNAIAESARAARQQMLKDRWNSDYSASKGVPANGYQILPEEQADLEAQGYRITPRLLAATAARHEGRAIQQAIRDEEERVRQENTAAKRERDGQMSRIEQQMRNTGQRYFIDSNRTVQPIKDPTTGRPLYNPTAWEEGVHPKTGQPVLTKRDNYGQVQYKTPSIVHNPDLTDDQLYYKFPNGKTVPAGKIEDLKNSQDFGIKRAAIKASGQRRAAQWKEAIAPLSDQAAIADQNHKLASQDVLDLQDKTKSLQEEISQLSVNPQLSETEGGFLGSSVGAKPTQAAQAIQAKLAAKEDELKRGNEQLSKLQDSLKSTGELGRAKRQSELELGIFKSKAQHDNYTNLADERRAILQAQGKPEAGDPTLAAILKAQDAYGAEIERYGATARTEGITPEEGPSQAGRPSPTMPVAPVASTGAHPLNSGGPLTDDQRRATTGARLPLGAPIPGIKNAYETVQTTPKLNDPVVDPENPDAPPPPHSKITLSQGSLPPTNSRIAKGFQDIQDKLAPAVDLLQTASSGIDAIRDNEINQGLQRAAAAKPGSGQELEPFAMAQQGKTHVGGVSVDELGKRYGSGEKGVSPLSMVKLKNRVTEINDTLNGSNQLDGKIQKSLAEERDYLTSLGTQRFARLSSDDQKKVTEATRPPTNWEIAKANVGAYAKESGKTSVDILQGMAKMASRAGALASSPAALTQMLSGEDDALTKKIDDYARWEKDAIEEYHAPTTSAEEKAQQHWTAQLSGTVGGFVPYMVGGAAAKVAGAGAAVQGAIGGASGMFGIGQSVRDQARVGLQKQLDQGKITKQDFDKGLNQAEGLGTLIGSSMMLPFGNFARLAGKTALGQKFVASLLEKLGQDGMETATKWVQSPAQQNILRRVATSTTEGAVTGFGQAVADNLTAQGKFGNVAYDKDRGTFEGASQSALSLGILGGIHGGLASGTLKGSIQEVADSMPNLFWKINETTPAEFRKAAEDVRKFGGTPEQQELVKKVAQAAEDTTARGIMTKRDPRAAQRMLQGVQTAEDMRLWDKIKKEVAGKSVSLGDVQRGRVEATSSEVGAARVTQKILPESLRPKAPEGGIKFNRVKGEEAEAAPKAEKKAAPAPAADTTPPESKVTGVGGRNELPAPRAEEAPAAEKAAAQSPAQKAPEKETRTDEEIAAEPNSELNKRAEPGPERDRLMAERRNAANRVTDTLKKGDKVGDYSISRPVEGKAGGKGEAWIIGQDGQEIGTPVSIAAELIAGEKITRAPAEELGPEAKKAGDEKVGWVKAALADKDTKFQYNVWDRKQVAPGRSRVTQVDLPSPNAPMAQGVRSHGAVSPDLLREMGVDLPEPPESLAPGRYTREQIEAAIAKEKASAATPESAKKEAEGKVEKLNDLKGLKENVAAELGNQRVTIKVKRGNGAEAEIEMSAKEAHKRVSDHLETLRKLRDCLEGKT